MGMRTERSGGEGRTYASARSAYGAGLITLDIIVQEQEPPSVAHAAGGTCGNVIAALAFLGWETTAVGRLGKDAAGRAIRQELTRLGVSGHQLTAEEHLNSARIVQFLSERRGTISHRYGFSCPACGHPFSRFRPPTREQAEAVLAKQQAPDVFFFDRVSSAILALAAEFRKRGALVYFEPSGGGRPEEFAKALEAAHIVKYSADRMRHVGTRLRALPGQRLEIETRGAKGLRFRWLGDGQSHAWQSQPAFKVRMLRDSAGAGDWCTAGLLYQLDWKKGREFEALKRDELAQAMMFGQALAALNCQHVGARGVTANVDSASMLNSVAVVQASGTTDTPSNVRSLKAMTRHGVSCETCLRE